MKILLLIQALLLADGHSYKIIALIDGFRNVCLSIEHTMFVITKVGTNVLPSSPPLPPTETVITVIIKFTYVVNTSFAKLKFF